MADDHRSRILSSQKIVIAAIGAAKYYLVHPRRCPAMTKCECKDLLSKSGSHNTYPFPVGRLCTRQLGILIGHYNTPLVSSRSFEATDERNSEREYRLVMRK